MFASLSPLSLSLHSLSPSPPPFFFCLVGRYEQKNSLTSGSGFSFRICLSKPQLCTKKSKQTFSELTVLDASSFYCASVLQNHPADCSKLRSQVNACGIHKACLPSQHGKPKISTNFLPTVGGYK